jgi:hypothetical protein
LTDFTQYVCFTLCSLAELWESSTFTALWRIILPLVNIYGLTVCLWALLLLFTEPKQETLLPGTSILKRGFLKDFSRNSLRIFVHFLELGGFVVRIAYCYCGPLFSTHKLTETDSLVLAHVTIPLEIIVSLLATSLFVRWNAFSINNRFIIPLLGFLLSITCGFPIVASIFFSLGFIPATAVIYLLVFFFLLMQLVSTWLFVRYGRKLIQELSPSRERAFTRPDWKTKSYHRAVHWVMMSAVMKAICMSGGFLAIFAPSWFSPSTYSTSYFLLLFGATGQAITQVIAFTPAVETNQEQDNQLVALGSPKVIFGGPSVATKTIEDAPIPAAGTCEPTDSYSQSQDQQ